MNEHLEVTLKHFETKLNKKVDERDSCMDFSKKSELGEEIDRLIIVCNYLSKELDLSNFTS